MKLSSILNELDSELENEMEIIYKDRDIFVMMPKSQKTSRLFGKGANWCQTGKPGFEMWSKVGLLIRFLMRGGRKIRFTYFYDRMPYGNHPKGSYYWANETGYHVLEGTNDPFDPKPKDPERIRSIEKDIIEQIAKIPEEARQKVREFIQKYKDGYDYCYREKEFYTKKELKLRSEMATLRNIVGAYNEGVQEVFGNRPKAFITFHFDSDKKVYYVGVIDNFEKKEAVVEKEFETFEETKKYLIDLANYYYEKHSKIWQPLSDFKK